MTKRCAACKHVLVTVDEEDPTDLGYECTLVMPFWVPRQIADYLRYVGPDDGDKCAAFQEQPDR